jgi:hypothetical protein
MTRRSGSADLPLHGSRVPKWLSDRMARLGVVIAEAIVHEFGRDELLRGEDRGYRYAADGEAIHTSASCHAGSSRGQGRGHRRPTATWQSCGRSRMRPAGSRGASAGAWVGRGPSARWSRSLKWCMPPPIGSAIRRVSPWPIAAKTAIPSRCPSGSMIAPSRC